MATDTRDPKCRDQWDADSAADAQRGAAFAARVQAALQAEATEIAARQEAATVTVAAVPANG